MKLTIDQSEEIVRCSSDFVYFFNNYVIIDYKNPMKLFPYQERLYEHLEANKYTIFSHFRQGGFTTQMVAYSLWKCLFYTNQHILYVDLNVSAGSLLNDMIKNLPNWLVGDIKWMVNTSKKEFMDTKSSIIFLASKFLTQHHTNYSLLILDGASHMNDMKEKWKLLQPNLQITQASYVIFSPVRYDDDWFYNTLENAKLNKIWNLNEFSVFSSSYKENEHLVKMFENISQNCESDIDYLQLPVQSPLENELEEDIDDNKKWRSIYD